MMNKEYASEPISIDRIMRMIAWDKSPKEQAAGIKLAKKVENFNVFLQPCNQKYNKNVWDNCAKILFERTDSELSPYLDRLFAWLQDLNWPGAACIFDRLQNYADAPSYDAAFRISIKCAQALSDSVWESNLKMLHRKIK